MGVATVADIRLLVRLVRADAAGIERGLAAGSPSLERLAEAAVAGGYSVTLLRALEGLGLRRELSPQRLDALEGRRGRQRDRSRVLFDALGRLADRFASAGQPLILLKGPYLASRFYGDVDAREFVDLDLLVPRASRARTVRVLESAGFTRRSRVILGQAVTSLFVHGFDFVAGEANVDLHWCLYRHPSIRLDDSAVWSGRQRYRLGERTYDVLGDEHEIVFEALSLLRDIERGRPKVKNVVDLVQVAAGTDGTTDWDGLLERGRGDGTFGPLINVLDLCLDVAGAHDLAPRLSSALTRHGDRRATTGPSGSLLGFSPASGTLANKRWSARAHDTTPVTWCLWWALSLPFRLAVHRHPPRPVASP